jgi:hypothetical protein
MSTTDTQIGKVTGGQHGAATRAQLLAAGVSPHVLDRRVRSGRLLLVHHGVYRLGTEEPTAWTFAMAAVLATSGGRSTGVVVSHAAAAVLWEYPGWDRPDIVDITRTAPGRVPGVRVHRVRSLCDDEVTRVRGVPVTTPARTVLDLAGCTTMRELEQALAAATRRARRHRGEIRRLLQRHPRHPGSGRLRQLLAALDAAGHEPLFLRSKAEERALLLVRRGGLAPPLANVRIAGFEVDFVWPAQRVILEVDGYEFHGSAAAFQRDRDRDRDLVASGYQVLRFSWRQLTDESEACLVALATALAQRTT